MVKTKTKRGDLTQREGVGPEGVADPLGEKKEGKIQYVSRRGEVGRKGSFLQKGKG